MDQVKGLGRAMLTAVLLMVGGVLNIIYGIAATGKLELLRTQHEVRVLRPQKAGAGSR